MTLVRASAPGKVVLSGEYAVLFGAPAICMAIDKRARVRISRARGNVCKVTAPGYCDVEGQFETTAEGLQWIHGAQQYALVDAVWNAADIASPIGFSNAAAIVLDTEDFIDNATRLKMGCGSSAALAVALAAALRRSDHVAAIAQRAHSELQAGAGSGVDVACSLHGGLIEYCMEGFRSTVLEWPHGLLIQLFWTGVPTSTTGKLAMLGNANERSGFRRPSRVRLIAAAEKIARAWRAGDGTAIISQYRDYVAALQSFSRDYELGIFDAGHQELVDAAAAEKLVYKPCGAGGGDVGIVFGEDAAKLQAFAASQSAKYSLLNGEIDYGGVTVEASLSEETGLAEK